MVSNALKKIGQTMQVYVSDRIMTTCTIIDPSAHQKLAKPVIVCRYESKGSLREMKTGTYWWHAQTRSIRHHGRCLARKPIVRNRQLSAIISNYLRMVRG